jgi:hypothetical protein
MTSDRRAQPSSSVQAFYHLLGLAIVLCVGNDIMGGIWKIHSGEYYPWGHRPFFPLLPTSFLVAKWLLMALSGGMFLFGWRIQWGKWVGFLGMLLDVSQQLHHHRFLILLVLFFLCIPSRHQPQQGLRLIQYQLLIVYIFSVIHKLTSKFYDGQSLVNLGAMDHEALLPKEWVRAVFSPTFSMPLSWSVIVLELAIPVLLLVRPKLGLGLAIPLHVTFSLFVPGVWPFTLIMIGMALLFLETPGQNILSQANRDS